MEPPMPPLHPKTPSLLDHLGLRIIDVVKWNLLLCVQKDDSGSVPTHVLKFGMDRRKTESVDYETRIMREVLPVLDREDFSRLVLPELLGSGEHDGLHWLETQYIAGQPLVHRWSELNHKPNILGGKGLEADTAVAVVDILRDLRSVDIGALPDFVRRFDLGLWSKEFDRHAEDLVRLSWLDQPSIDFASELFSKVQTERYQGSMFTNGDFYPRNFILLPEGKLAVVDWVGGVDPWEFVAVHAWLMMWGNPDWQKRYVQELKVHFPVDLGALQVGLVVRSFDLLWRWKDESEADLSQARAQMSEYLRQCLDPEYVRRIFE
ncbi:hypothetical protein COY93_00940 [Candidatus Uhrbacteria bacterium CG_4_10_14_0_8_um_filter_58_22]|uniref:Aminoglycoside phosphotransferase domain-containing protein n=1 Tax=Candidatus Uhrbacteria bacterium CG_4_10_14_0_8_um_filter_58_22 TaxID=1975029 RepID=A0A2M7QAQ4_9BACT|nr:MAG: hypothetical protein COY93_00940 [Candidatus Uhrbacteria bacterium CG_4_10_14_0_8_um_filter_58_22]